MKSIVIVNSKGGVGKSNITRHLAVVAEQEHPGSVVLCDTDPQGSLADWWNAREAETPKLAIVGLSDFEEQRRLLATQFHYLFFDATFVQAQSYRPVLLAADLIVIPVIPSPDDVRSLTHMTLPLVKASGRPFIFVMSKSRQRTRLLASTIAALSDHGPISPAVIEQREGYALSSLHGSTLLEDDPHGRGAHEIQHLWEVVQEHLRHPVDESTRRRTKKTLDESTRRRTKEARHGEEIR